MQGSSAVKTTLLFFFKKKKPFQNYKHNFLLSVFLIEILKYCNVEGPEAKL